MVTKPTSPILIISSLPCGLTPRDASRLLPDAGLLTEQRDAHVRRPGLDTFACRIGELLEYRGQLLHRADLPDIAHDLSLAACWVFGRRSCCCGSDPAPGLHGSDLLELSGTSKRLGAFEVSPGDDF